MPRIEELRTESVVAYRLTIEGLAIRPVCLPAGVTLTPQDVPGTHGDIQYQDINCLMPPRDQYAEIDPIGDMVEASGLAIELVTDDDTAAEYDLESFDAALTRVGAFMTLLPTGARWFALVLRTVAAADTTIYIDRDLSQHSYPRGMWIGHEMVWVLAALGDSAAMDAADPFRLTVERAAGATRATDYIVQPEQSDYATIYSDFVSWHRRRAILEIAPVWGTPGQPGCMVPDDGWLERPRGFVETTPQVGDGVLRMRLHPLSSIADTEVEVPPTTTQLVHGHHYFKDRRGGRFDWGVYTERAELRATYAAVAADSGSIPVSTDRHSEIFDVNLPADHPRRGRVSVEGSTRNFQVTGYNAPGAGPPAEAIQIATGPARAEPVGTRVVSAPCVELKHLRMPRGQVIEWPGGFIDAVNAATDDSVDGLRGAHATLQIVPADADGWAAAVQSNLWDAPATKPIVLLIDPFRVTGDPRIYRTGRFTWPWHRAYGPDPLKSWDDVGRPFRRTRQAFNLLHYPVFYRVGDSGRSDARGAEESQSDGVQWLALRSDVPGPIRRVFEFPAGYYQTGERGILVRSPVPAPPPGQAGLLTAYWHEPWWPNAEEMGQAMRYTDVEPVAMPDGSTAYYITLERPMYARSFGDWPGLPEGRIDISLGGIGGAALIEQLFTQYLPYTADDIDIESLHRFADPAGLTITPPVTGTEPVELRQVLHGLMLATNTALVNRTDNLGRSRLTRVPTGLESPVESVMFITDDDMIAPPTYGADGDVYHKVIIKAGYGSDGEPGMVATFIKRGTAPESGGDLNTLEIELRSIVPMTMNDLLPIAQRILALKGRPRRTWTIDIPLGVAYTLFPGAVIEVASEYLRGYGPGVGIGVWTRGEGGRITAWHSGLHGRIRRIEENHTDGTARLTVAHHGARGSGWHTALRILSIVSPTRVQVDGGDWSPLEHPVTGEPYDPLSTWRAGGNASVVPFANHDVGPTLAITVLQPIVDDAPAEIEFDGAHGLAGVFPFGEIEPPPYDLQSNRQRQLANLADDEGLLGEINTLGFDLV